MYVCGVTVYDYCHLGHARCYVAFDVIYRYLEYLGYEVKYIQNVTDLDDKLIKKAREGGGEGDMKDRVARIAKKYEDAYREDMKKLGVLEHDYYPKATGHIEEMQEIIKCLIEKGCAYQRGGNVYFEVAAFPEYGELSGKNLDDLKAGARVKVEEEKKNPLDFALWKESAEGEPAWSSPWGEGRPGWHIECSAMSMKELGPTFDIHGGGQDLIFPHHENERAQSMAYSGKPFARYWLHNGFVKINREKMSKSLGNVFNLRDIFERFSPQAVRFFLLSQHYRSPVDYSEEALTEAKESLKRLDECYSKALIALGDIEAEPEGKAMESFRVAMNDDFNTAAALAVVYDLVNKFYQKKDSPEASGELKAKIRAMVKICDILGLELRQIKPKPKSSKIERLDPAKHAGLRQELLNKEMLSTNEIWALVLARQELREQKKWEEADEIRENLKLRNIEIQDNKDGTSSPVYYEEDLKPLK